MRTLQLKVRKGVIECFGVELNDIDGTPFMICMASFALRRAGIRPLTVKTGLLRHIGGDILVTIKAKPPLALL